MSYPLTHPINMPTPNSTREAIENINEIFCAYGLGKHIQTTHFRGDINELKQAFPYHIIHTSNDIIKKDGHINEVLQKYPHLRSDSDVYFGNYGSMNDLLRYFPEILNPYKGHKIIFVDFSIKPK